MSRGRPTKSAIRQNLVELLYYVGQGYGYDLAKMYNEVFPPVTQRSIYYHLKKGVQLQEFVIHEIKEEKGDYSWGQVVEKVYYTLGSAAKPCGEKRVKDFLQAKGVKLWSEEQPPHSKSKFMKFVGKFQRAK